jgi:hypothetical protein
MLLLAAAISLLGVAAMAADKVAGKAKAIPPFPEVKAAVERYLQGLPDYHDGDLLTRDQVEPLLNQLKKAGLPLPDGKQILDSVPMADEFWVRELRTPDGVKFMRRIGRFRGAYDRLDRLSRMPSGQRHVRNLIHEAGGDKMIEFMTTTTSGKKLGNVLDNAPGGTDFNMPTGRIYNAEMLLARLERSHAASLKAAKH